MKIFPTTRRQNARYALKAKCVRQGTGNQISEQRHAPLEFVPCDLAGPIELVAKDGFKYALSFVDRFSGTN